QFGGGAGGAGKGYLLALELAGLESEVVQLPLDRGDLVRRGVAAHLDEHAAHAIGPRRGRQVAPRRRRFTPPRDLVYEPTAIAPSGTRGLVLSLDVGTTGVRAVLPDETGGVTGQAYRGPLPAYPAPGHVEHDLEALLTALLDVARAVIEGVTLGRVRALGLATQRATAVAWDAISGRPLGPGLSWQDTRTQARCQELMGQGLMITPLMAASKIEWLLDRADPDRVGVRTGRVRCGTLDAWLAARLTGGRVHATDASNASC